MQDFGAVGVPGGGGASAGVAPSALRLTWCTFNPSLPLPPICVVDSGFVVDPGCSRPRNPPLSPDPPQRCNSCVAVTLRGLLGRGPAEGPDGGALDVAGRIVAWLGWYLRQCYRLLVRSGLWLRHFWEHHAEMADVKRGDHSRAATMARLTASFASNRIAPLAVTVVGPITLQGAVRAAARAARYLGGSRHPSGLRGDGVLVGAAAGSVADQ